MDAVEFPFPAAVAVSKLLRTEGFGRGGVSVGEGAAREPIADVPIFGSSSVSGFSTSRSRKDKSCAATILEQNSVSRDKRADVVFCAHESIPSLGSENFVNQLSVRDANNSLFVFPKCAGKQLHQKPGKQSRSSSSCCKRPRTEQVEDSTSEAGTDDSNILSGKLEPSLTKCTFADKSQAVRQKHNLDGKRGDKRNLKAPTKTKFDSFISKAGSVSSNSAAEGNNILGIYGLKSDIQDVTKHVDELSLNELLDGSYEFPSLCQDKGKKAENTNENILHSVRKASSILQFQRAVQSQNAFELDSSSNRKTGTRPLSSESCVTSGFDCDKGDNYTADLISSGKIQDSCSKPGAPVSLNASLLYQPKEVLQRLAIPPAKDLDSLLLDTPKPAVSLKSTPHLWSGKPISHRARLLPFPWTHSGNGSCKTNMDTGKLSTNRSTCQGRWVRIASTASYLGDGPSCFSDLDSLTYDHNLIPSEQPKLGLSENEKAPYTPVRFPWFEQVSSSTVPCDLASHVPDKTILKGLGAMSSHHSLKLNLPQKPQDSLDPQLKIGFDMGIFLKSPETEGNLKYRENGMVSMCSSPNDIWFQENGNNYMEEEQAKKRKNAGSADSSCYSVLKCPVGECNKLQWHLHAPENSNQDGHSPRLLAAAQTLYEIANHSRMQIQPSGKIRWSKKLSQKAMKACKSRSSTGKTDVICIAPKPVDPAKVTDQITPLKKPKSSTTDKRKDICQTNNVGRGVMNWSIPASSRSSPSRLERDFVADTKQLNADTVKLLGVVASSTHMDKACNSQQKPRKAEFMHWGRGRIKNE